jgi:amino acid adenylation domain-containing protein
MARRVTVEMGVRTFLDRFREIVEVCRDRPAIVQDSRTITYSQLDRCSNALAATLVRAGIGPDVIVGLLVDRTPDLLIALLGILKAGGAYVPLDPTLPPARLAYMIDDAGAALVVSSARIGPVVPPEVRRIDVDERQDANPPSVALKAEHRAYVLYTSGSTGAPKAVEITHASIANLIDAFRDEPGLTTRDRVLAHSAISFDISIIELWLPLVFGATIVLPPAADDRDPRALARLIAREQITFVCGTPSFFRLLLDAGWRDGQGRTVFSGGEPMSRELTDALIDTGAAVWNIYGPTETTVWTTAWHARKGEPIVVGRPIRNTQVHILDPSLNPVPAGDVGEICISGAGLARGYLNRPALTTEKFLRHPLAGPPDGRLYRTGDLGRLRGRDIEVLGRVDRQIKIDGFRIEPGEIESALARHPRVRHAIVRAVERGPGDVRLVAYIVHGSWEPPAIEELLALSKRRLPTHMLPASFVMLQATPLTAHGKVDYAALPAPDWSRATVGSPISTPRTATERRLLEMWRGVLGLGVIGVDDDFFDIGGRSRLGAALFARIDRELGVRLPLATLFEAPTIATLARVIDAVEGKAEKVEDTAADSLGKRTPISWNTLVAIRATGCQAPLFFVHPVGGNVLVYRELIGHIDPSVPCFGLQATGLDGVRAPLSSVEEMAERYVSEIQKHQARGPYRLCGYSFGGLVAFAMGARLRASGEAVEFLALIDTPFPDWATVDPGAQAQPAAPGNPLNPTLARARRHASSFRRLGLGGYIRAITGDRRQRGSRSEQDPVRAANLAAAARYIPPPYDGSLIYFRAAADTPAGDRRGCWRSVAPGMVMIDVDGRHADLRYEPGVQVIAREINARLVYQSTSAT